MGRGAADGRPSGAARPRGPGRRAGAQGWRVPRALQFRRTSSTPPRRRAPLLLQHLHRLPDSPRRPPRAHFLLRQLAKPPLRASLRPSPGAGPAGARGGALGGPERRQRRQRASLQPRAPAPRADVCAGPTPGCEEMISPAPGCSLGSLCWLPNRARGQDTAFPTQASAEMPACSSSGRVCRCMMAHTNDFDLGFSLGSVIT